MIRYVPPRGPEQKSKTDTGQTTGCDQNVVRYPFR